MGKYYLQYTSPSHDRMAPLGVKRPQTGLKTFIENAEKDFFLTKAFAKF